MPDPLSLVALGAAVGGAAGKLVEKAYDSGERWLQNFFRDHQPKALEVATENARDFLSSFACRVRLLEEQNTVPKERIEDAQNWPESLVLIQKALLSAAQTNNQVKHQVLAELVATKLERPPEDTLSLATQRACETVASLTINQLNILGLQATALFNRPESKLDELAYHEWLVEALAPFLDVEIGHMDIPHLEALSCLQRQTFLALDFTTARKHLNGGDFDWIKFKECETGRKFSKLWDGRHGLASVKLTSIGYLIGQTIIKICDGSPNRTEMISADGIETLG